MKRILFSIITATLIFLSGCEKGLEPEIYGSLTPNNFPVTVSDFELLVLEVYVPFSCKWPYGEGGSENSYHIFGLEEGHIHLFDGPTDHYTIFTDWGDGGPLWDSKSRGNFEPMVSNWEDRSHFNKTKFVTRMTNIIDLIESSEAFTDESVRNKLLGETRMARGWAMYFMLHLFGPVPVILDPALVGTDAESDLTLPSRSEYVNAIVSDLRFAADNLPVSPDQYGRFNSGLALTALMRLHLNELDFVNAESVGRELLNMGYSLVEDYSSLFREVTERNTETIFAISADPLGQGRGNNGHFNAYSYYCRPWDFDGRNGWATVWTATWDFYDSFDANDTRRERFIIEYTFNDELIGRADMHGAYIDKYPPEGPNAFQGNDIVLARYADVLLMLAEAVNENNNGPTQEAVDLLNMIRTRAEITTYLLGDFTGVDDFNDAILEERGKELFFEGLRKFDLVRHDLWPSALEGVEGKEPSFHLLPYPQYIIDRSDGQITQRPEYN